MKFTTVPLKNIFGNFGRSLSFGFFILFTLVLATSVNSFISSAKSNMEDNIITALTGHIQALSPLSKENNMFSFQGRWDKTDYLRDNEVHALENIFIQRGLNDYVKRVRHNAIFITDDSKQPAMIIGLDLKSDTYQETFELTQGRYLDKNNTHEILLAEQQAKELNAKAGDTLSVLSQTKDGYTVDSALTVAGIGNIKMLSMWGFSPVYMDISGARELAGFDKEVSDIIVYINDKYKADKIVSEINQIIEKAGINDSVKLSTWEQKSSILIGWVNLFKVIFNIFLFFLLVIIIILIVNLVAMIGLERRREIGTFRAIGFSQLKTIFLFISEVLLITLFFSLIGMILSIGLISFLKQTGIPISYNGLIWMTGKVFVPRLDIIQIILSTGIILGCAVLASLHPSYKATSQKPSEILNEM